MGTPILGDRKYGIRDKCKELMLIAYYLKFDDHVLRLIIINILMNFLETNIKGTVLKRFLG